MGEVKALLNIPEVYECSAPHTTARAGGRREGGTKVQQAVSMRLEPEQLSAAHK